MVKMFHEVLLTYFYFVSLGAEGAAVKEKVVEKVAGRGASFGRNTRPW